jgi:predicted nucleic acid-binding protein
LYILDSDIFDDLVYPSRYRPRILAKINEVGQLNVWFSAVTAYEKLKGAIPEIANNLNPRDPADAPKQLDGFKALLTLLEKFKGSQLLPFTPDDFGRYQEVFKAVKKSPMDCRIAASALTRGWTVVTRNAADFEVIKKRAGVKVEYWADAPRDL